MTYKLAKQLKDAGFSQKEQGRGYFLAKDKLVELPTGIISGVDVAYVPTLSELIEACVRLKQIGEFHLETVGDEWCVGIREANGEHHWLYRGIYKTPEEAVAKLWLALNSKND